MKYIRTKDGVYKVVDTYETKYVVGYTEDDFEKVIYKENIINQSENLEELCDEFVYCPNGGTIKGAIWTDKGLIYVAKMDSEGKLELI